MADFPTEPYWLRTLLGTSPHVEDRRTFLNEATANDFYRMFDAYNLPDAKPGLDATGGYWYPRFNPNDQLQKALGYGDMLKYPVDRVKPVVESLRHTQQVPLPRKRPYGGN